MLINLCIQARMSSVRYPGKVLAPIAGKPLIKHLIDSANQVTGVAKVLVVTSNQQSDDPLAGYLDMIGCAYYRGPLVNVFKRFQEALIQHPSDYCVRLCADSPYISVDLLQFMVDKCTENAGKIALLSNVQNRRFPKGQSVEIIASKHILETDPNYLSHYEQEHVMPYFYKSINKKETLFYSLKKDLSIINQCIDSVSDLASSASYEFEADLVEEVRS